MFVSDIKNKLDSAEGRCNVLEKQLEYMRRMVQNAEQDRSEALRKTALLQHQRADVEEKDLRSHLTKISELEREHLKLTATQTLAEVREHLKLTATQTLAEVRGHLKLTATQTLEGVREHLKETRKLISVLLNSYVNLMVWCCLFRKSTNFSNSVSPYVHIRNI